MHTPSSHEPPDLRAYWGKAGTGKAADTVPHPLVCHTIDTAMVAELLYDRLLGPHCRAELADALAALGEVRRWAALLAGLHDLGKLSVAFQALRADVAARFLTGPARDRVTKMAEVRGSRRADRLHGDFTAYHIRRLLESWGAPRKTAQTLGYALGGHHGIYPSPDRITEAKDAIGDNGGTQWAAQVDEFVRLVAHLVGLPDPETLPWSKVNLETGAAVALAGLTTVSDWIASGSVDGEYAGVEVDLAEYVERSRQRAAEHVIGRLRWSLWTPPPDLSYQRLFGKEDAHPLQQEIAKLIATKSTPGILVIDAPTGEGKTYAALHASVHLIRELGLAGLYFAMPTRATANQAFEEIDTMLGRLKADNRPQLLHGTAAQYLADRRVRVELTEPLVPTGIGVDEPDGDQDTATGEWFTRSRELLSPWAVGTIDRLQRAGIRDRWAPVPLAGISNRVVILDEIHGYDVYMSTILDRLLWWLGHLEVPVIMLSATLPRVRRDELVRAWYAGARGGEPDDVTLSLPSTPYPGALWLDRTGKPEVTKPVSASERNHDRRIRLEYLQDAELVDWAVGQASNGRGVAIIHNLVRRVNDTDAGLAEAIERLPEADRPRLVKLTRELSRQRRNEVEAELRELFGPTGTRAPAAGYIVVSTQILEQSLDLDFDAMATDLAPIDSMLQRAGRLHRFRQTDPVSPPLLFVTGVTTHRSGPGWPPYTKNIYDDAVLLRTWIRLRDHPELRLPDAVPTLTNGVYGTPPDCPAGWERRWAEADRKLLRAREVDASRARHLFLPPPNATDVLRELTKHPESRFLTRKPDRRGRQYER